MRSGRLQLEYSLLGRRPVTVAFTLVILSPVVWLLFRRRRRLAQRTDMRIVAVNLSMLDHICVSLGTILREWPELREIRLDVAALPRFDEAAIASLQGAIATAKAADVELRIDGCTAAMSRMALGCGIPMPHLGEPRPGAMQAPATLH